MACSFLTWPGVSQIVVRCIMARICTDAIRVSRQNNRAFKKLVFVAQLKNSLRLSKNQ